MRKFHSSAVALKKWESLWKASSQKIHPDSTKRKKRAETNRALRVWRFLNLDADEQSEVKRKSQESFSLRGVEIRKTMKTIDEKYASTCTVRMEDELRFFINGWKGLYGRQDGHDKTWRQYQQSQNEGCEGEVKKSRPGRNSYGQNWRFRQAQQDFENERKDYEREQSWEERNFQDAHFYSSRFSNGKGRNDYQEFNGHSERKNGESSYGCHGRKNDRYNERTQSQKRVESAACPRQILGLPASGDLNSESVKIAFRNCALRWHPDRHIDSEKDVAEAKFKAAVEAYESLQASL